MWEEYDESDLAKALSLREYAVHLFGQAGNRMRWFNPLIHFPPFINPTLAYKLHAFHRNGLYEKQAGEYYERVHRTNFHFKPDLILIGLLIRERAPRIFIPWLSAQKIHAEEFSQYPGILSPDEMLGGIVKRQLSFENSTLDMIGILKNNIPQGILYRVNATYPDHPDNPDVPVWGPGVLQPVIVGTK